MKYFIGFLVGILAGLAYAHRRDITNIWSNRKEISAAGKTVGGIQDTISGVTELIDKVLE